MKKVGTVDPGNLRDDAALSRDGAYLAGQDPQYDPGVGSSISVWSVADGS